MAVGSMRLRIVLSPLIVLALAVGACGDAPPPGARPITEADRQAAPAPDAPPAGARAVPPQPIFGPDSPRVVSTDPPSGATGVDPSRTTLSVTFDRPMDPEGWAWVVEDPATAPEIGEARFDPSLRTNTVPVELEPGRDYVVWINSERFPYFKGADGTPALPFRWTFTTASASEDGAVGLVRSQPSADSP